MALFVLMQLVPRMNLAQRQASHKVILADRSLHLQLEQHCSKQEDPLVFLATEHFTRLVDEFYGAPIIYELHLHELIRQLWLLMLFFEPHELVCDACE